MSDETKEKDLDKKIEEAKKAESASVELASQSDVDKAKAHLNKIVTDLTEEYAGKQGYNPFLWAKNKVNPLLKILESPAGVSVAQVKKIMAFTPEPPVTGDEQIPVRLIPNEKLQPKVGNAKPQEKS